MHKSLFRFVKPSREGGAAVQEAATVQEQQGLLQSQLEMTTELSFKIWARHVEAMESARRNFIEKEEGSETFYRKVIKEAQEFVNTHLSNKVERQAQVNYHNTTLDPDAIVLAPAPSARRVDAFFKNPAYVDLSPPPSPVLSEGGAADEREIFGVEVDDIDNCCCCIS